MEYDTGTAWMPVTLPNEAKTLVLVLPNSSVTQTLPVTATDVAWRITAFCIEQATGLPRAVERAEELGKQALTGQKADHFSGRKYLIKAVSPLSGKEQLRAFERNSRTHIIGEPFHFSAPRPPMDQQGQTGSANRERLDLIDTRYQLPTSDLR